MESNYCEKVDLLELKIESVVVIVDRLMLKHRYAAAREVILREWNRIIEPINFHMLGHEAKVLVKIIAKEKEMMMFSLLTNRDKRILNLLNEAVRDVRFPYARRLFMEHKDLIVQAHAKRWLTSDARYMCFAWEKNM